AVLGVINMLVKLLREHEPEHIAVVFDASGKTFRDELSADYKANRPPMPDELRSQLAVLLEVVEAMGLPLLRVTGVEADDVIGTLAVQASAERRATLISTGDKDMAQLVNEHVTLVNTMSDTTLDPDGVEKKFGVRPTQIVDYLALVGDSIDNIPGIPRVGAKTAAKWLGLYDDIDGIVANAEAIKGKVGESLREHLEQLPLSRALATIKTDVELDATPAELARGEPDNDRLRAIYTRLELRSLLTQLDGEAPGDEASVDADETTVPPAVEGDYEMVLDAERFEHWVKRLEASELFAFDTETTSLDYMEAVIVGVSFAVKAGEAAYVPVAHDYPGAPDQLDRDTVLERLRPLLEDDARAKVGHHLKYDAHVLRNHGIALRGMRYDSMLESYVLNSTASRHDMDSLAKKYLGRETVHYEDVAGKGAKQITFDQVPLDTAAPYAAEDADITLQLHATLRAQLDKAPGLSKLYREIEQPLVPVLAAMEYTGVLLDSAMLAAQSKELETRGLELVEQAYDAAGESFNLGSPKQLQEILFQRLGLPVLRKTPKGQPSTAEDVLQELANDYPLPKIILEYRSLTKLKSTYTDKLPQQINARTGRVHTSYHQAVAATGRLSSTNPNLQNIPIRTPEGRRIRQAFVPPDGHVLLAADYSQIELRIMAHLSGDEGLLSAFAADRDIH
ncbi:MAG: DNA polymerase I, partial [Pseudomonadota bacterium]